MTRMEAERKCYALNARKDGYYYVAELGVKGYECAMYKSFKRVGYAL